MDISSHTKSEQPRVAGKHLTRLAKNGMVAVTYIATLLRGPPSVVSAIAAALAGFVYKLHYAPFRHVALYFARRDKFIEKNINI